MWYSKRLLVFASMAALGACNDRPAPAPTGPAAAPAAPTRTELTGTVLASGRDEAVVYLQTQDGLIALVGNGAIPMMSVDHAQVQVDGSWDANSALIVDSFVVVAVKGQPAFDGILEQMSDGYALRLADGTDQQLTDPPKELLIHVGARVWVTQSPDATTLVFGVIQEDR
jgi:hypothetical protein